MIKREMDLSAQICLIRACGPGISGIFLKFATKLKDERIINEPNCKLADFFNDKAIYLHNSNFTI